MSSAFSKASRSSKSSEYGTPLSLYNKLNLIFNFEIDPCAWPDNYLDTRQFYTKEEDGLKRLWNGNTFINPPFGAGANEWITKMHNEASRRFDQYVMLLPARTDTRWFQDLIVGQYYKDSFIYFLKGRFKFIDRKTGTSSNVLIIGNMLWIKNATYEQKIKLMETIKGVMFVI